MGWHLLLLWLWFGLTMNGLLNLMHEAAHYSVFRPRWASDVLGDWVMAPMVLADFVAYRNRHWDHHRHLGTDRDTKYTYLVDVRGWRLPGLLVRCLLLVEAVRKFFHQLPSESTESSRPKTWILRGALVQLLLVSSLFGTAWLAHPGDPGSAFVAFAFAYFFTYHYGLAGLTVFMAALRAIAEHQVDEQAPVVEGRAALRNFRDNPLSRLLLGAYGFSEHATHHLNPQVPSYRLTLATKELVGQGRTDLSFGPGYTPTLVRLWRRRGEKSNSG